jgi:hypothetical protein
MVSLVLVEVPAASPAEAVQKLELREAWVPRMVSL